MSLKPLAQRLFIKKGYRIALLNMPEDYEIYGLPSEVTISHNLSDTYDMIQIFTQTQEQVKNELDRLKSHLKASGALWISYPKGTKKAKLPTDMSRDILYRLMLDIGVKASYEASVDDVWSALRFKWDNA